MTRVGRWFRNLLERMFRRYYEGPEVPRRLLEEPQLFRAMYPLATPDEWERFAQQLTSNAYRDGFVRGYEWQERDWPGEAAEPELMAEATAHDWSLAEQDPRVGKLLEQRIDPNDPLAHLDVDQRRAYYEQIEDAYDQGRTVEPDE